MFRRVDDGALKLAERRCVYHSLLVDNALCSNTGCFQGTETSAFAGSGHATAYARAAKCNERL